MGKFQAAEKLLLELETRFSPPQIIQDVIASLRSSRCHLATPSALTTVRLGRGRDTNVNQGSSKSTLPIDTNFGQLTLVLLPEFLARADDFSTLTLEHQRPASLNGATFNLFYQNRRYDHLARYNIEEVQFAAEQPWQTPNYSFRAGAAQGYFILNNALYLRQSTLQIELTPFKLLPQPFIISLASGAFFLNYPGIPNFDAKILESRLTLAHRSGQRLLQAMAAQQYDDADGARPGGNRRGQLFSVYGRGSIREGWIGEIRLDHQFWFGKEPYQPGFLDNIRRQETSTLRLGLTYKINSENNLTAEWKKIINRENIPVFAYENNVFQLSWQHQFTDL